MTGPRAMNGCPDVRIGTAGWSIPKPHAALFPETGTHLQRYARRFNAVEINSSFYRPHRPATYARWAASVPEDFRFSVKLPREITHTRRLGASHLGSVHELLEKFLQETKNLTHTLGPLLVQLPPSLRLDGIVANEFFSRLRDSFSGHVVCEPRHPTWFTPEADAILTRHHTARVAADPAPVPPAAAPGGDRRITYRRLHGSPRTYYSAYPPEYLDATANAIRADAVFAQEHWCIFDNTAEGHATLNALALSQRLRQGGDIRGCPR